MTAQPGRDPHSAEMMDSLVRASFTVIALLSRVAAEHDLSLTQLRVLAILRDREPTMAELATYLGLERSSVSGLIDRAVRRGLVRRNASKEDGRAVRVSLTPDGQRLAGLGAAEISDLITPMTRSLSLADQKRLGVLLNRMLEELSRSAWPSAATELGGRGPEGRAGSNPSQSSRCIGSRRHGVPDTP